MWMRTKRKNPILAALLSALLVGLGQIYNGERSKGILLMILFAISLFSILIYGVYPGDITRNLAFIGIVMAIIIWAFGISDAYIRAGGKSEDGFYDDFDFGDD